MALMTRHQRQIFAYIYTLVPDRHDAEDLLQETSLVVCEKFNTSRPAPTSSRGPARSRGGASAIPAEFARSKVIFDDEVLAAVAQTAGEMAHELDERHEALAGCLKKLPSRDRELVLTR